jgi:hypothetical protein
VTRQIGDVHAESMANQMRISSSRCRSWWLGSSWQRHLAVAGGGCDTWSSWHPSTLTSDAARGKFSKSNQASSTSNASRLSPTPTPLIQDKSWSGRSPLAGVRSNSTLLIGSNPIMMPSQSTTRSNLAHDRWACEQIRKGNARTSLARIHAPYT